MAAVPPAICTVSDRMAANRKRFSFRISALGTMLAAAKKRFSARMRRTLRSTCESP